MNVQTEGIPLNCKVQNIVTHLLVSMHQKRKIALEIGSIYILLNFKMSRLKMFWLSAHAAMREVNFN
jgi:hypothetical protein